MSTDAEKNTELTEPEARDKRLGQEITSLFDRGILSRDPILEYQWAVEHGDTERAEVIAEIGPQFLGVLRRGELARLVKENKLRSLGNLAFARKEHTDD